MQTVGAKTRKVILNELFVFRESAHGQRVPGLGPDGHIFPLWEVEVGPGKRKMRGTLSTNKTEYQTGCNKKMRGSLWICEICYTLWRLLDRKLDSNCLCTQGNNERRCQSSKVVHYLPHRSTFSLWTYRANQICLQSRHWIVGSVSFNIYYSTVLASILCASFVLEEVLHPGNSNTYFSDLLVMLQYLISTMMQVVKLFTWS